jgi:hypothetical protein
VLKKASAPPGLTGISRAIRLALFLVPVLAVLLFKWFEVSKEVEGEAEGSAGVEG